MTVLSEQRGPVLVLTIDRPPVNALDAGARAGIREALADAADRVDVRAIVLTGAGRHFSAGQDMQEPAIAADGGIPESVLADFDALCHELTWCPKPTIAAVNGGAIGGGLEVALSCDLRIAGESARFAAVGARMGLISSTQRLVRVVGEAQAKRLAFTGARVGAEEAVRIGLAHTAVPDGELLDAAVALGQEIAAAAPLSVARAKEAINRAWELPLAEGLKLQREFFLELSGTDDHREAVRAFREKREPRFEAR